MSAQPRPARAPRVRDPERADKILAAAARLFANQGFHAVSLGDVGQEAGIVGSGVYRHFDNKVAVLVALLDQAMDDLMRSTDAVLAQHLPPSETLSRLVDTQIEFCLEHRLAVQLYRTELTALSAADAGRLRLLQRRYNDAWLNTLHQWRPELSNPLARALVHATIGAIQSTATYESALDRSQEAATLHAVAWQCLSAGVSVE